MLIADFALRKRIKRINDFNEREEQESRQTIAKIRKRFQTTELNDTKNGI
jgi:hypothetical protein